MKWNEEHTKNKPTTTEKKQYQSPPLEKNDDEIESQYIYKNHWL